MYRIYIYIYIYIHENIYIYIYIYIYENTQKKQGLQKVILFVKLFTNVKHIGFLGLH